MLNFTSSSSSSSPPPSTSSSTLQSSDHPSDSILHLPNHLHHHQCYPTSHPNHCLYPLSQSSTTDTYRDSISSRTLSNPHSDSSPRSVIHHIHSSTSSAPSPDLSHPTCFHASSVNTNSSSIPLHHHHADHPPIASPTCPVFHNVNQGTVLLVNNQLPAFYQDYQHNHHHLQPWSLCAPTVVHHLHYGVDSITEEQKICNNNHSNRMEYGERNGRNPSAQKAGSKSADFARLRDPSRCGSTCKSGMLEKPHMPPYSYHNSHETASMNGTTTYPTTQRRSLDHWWVNMENNISCNVRASESTRSYTSSRSTSTTQLADRAVQRNSSSYKFPPKSPQAQNEDVDEFGHHMHPYLSSKWEDADKWVTNASELNSTNRWGTMLRNSGNSIINDVPITTAGSGGVRDDQNESRSVQSPTEDQCKKLTSNSTSSTNYFDGRVLNSKSTYSRGGEAASPSISAHPLEYRDEPNARQDHDHYHENPITEQSRKDSGNQAGTRRQPNTAPHPALHNQEVKASIKQHAVPVDPRTDRFGDDTITQLVLEKFGDIDNINTTKDQVLIPQRLAVSFISLREAGTQMSSIDGSGSISRDPSKSGSPQKWSTPSGYTTPARIIPLHALTDSDILKGKERRVSHLEELAQYHYGKLDLQALPQGDSFHRTTSNWSSREVEEADLSRSLRHSMDLDGHHNTSNHTQTPSHAWDKEDESKVAKLQLKEARIHAWEEKQKKKADAQLKRLEEKLAKQRSITTNKILGSLALAQRRAEEMRASVHAQHNKTSKRGQRICHRSLSPLSYCTCLSAIHE